jgi:hypothetical protein
MQLSNNNATVMLRSAVGCGEMDFPVTSHATHSIRVVKRLAANMANRFHADSSKLYLRRAIS